MTAEWSVITPAEIAGGDKSALAIGPFGSSLKTSDFVPDGVPLVFVRDIREVDFSTPRAYVTRSKADELRAHIALPGDVLVTKMGDPPGDACIYTGQGPAVITADCIRLRPSPEFDAGFIVHSLQSPSVRRQILSITSGVAQQKVSLERFRSGVKLAVPPLGEQRRIAAILDQADANRTRRRRVLTHFDALTSSLFAATVKGVDRTLSLRDMEVDFVSGKNVLGGGLDAHQCNKVIKVSAISSGRFLLQQSKPMPKDYSPPLSHLVQEGDILFGRASGSMELLGATAVVDVTAENLYLPDKVWRLSVKPNAPVLARYVLGILRSSPARDFIRHNASGAAGVRNIGKSKLLEYRAPLPSLNMQREYVTRVTQVDAQRRTVHRALSADDELFSSLQARAFRGEL